MHFTRLRLRGFKSFVDPTEVPIEPGLTGIVGPNGCGKSNIVEALRWVMGETSAKRVRGGEMDDVIFAGSRARPQHTWAEVALTLDNRDGTAPARFNDAGELEVTRRIEREKGSTYRVNGAETRARDVQLLFADQATGAGATALVSQGRVTHVIHAKPSERRQLLEEAAGITGLHTRRREAEQRLRTAEQNLERLDDRLDTQEAQLTGLEREARRARRYRWLSRLVRRHEAILLHLDAVAAQRALAQARQQHEDAEERVAEAERRAAAASTEQANAQAALPELRQAEQDAASEVSRLTRERDGLAHEEKRVAQEAQRVRDRLDQITRDRKHAQTRADDARAAMERLETEDGDLAAAMEGERDARASAQEARDAAQREVEDAERAVNQLTERIAEQTAKAKSLDDRLAEVRKRRDKLQRDADTVARQEAELDAPDDAAVAQAAERVTAGEQALEAAQAEAEAAERALAETREADEAAQTALREAESARDRLTAEIDALRRVAEPQQEAGGDHPPVLDSVAAEPGAETALAAALGDALQTPVAADAPVRWTELPPLDAPPPLPAGTTCLADLVTAPPALHRRLACAGVVADRETGAALQARLAPGQVLVSRDGDCWRWDGYTADAAAEAPAAAERLRQRNRLAELRGQLPDAEHAVEQARARRQEASDAAKAARERDAAARKAVRDAETELRAARDDHAKREKAAADARSRLDALREQAERLATEIAEQDRAIEEVEAERANLPDLSAERDRLDELRRDLAGKRETLTARQRELDEHDRAARQRAERRRQIADELASWRQRAESASSHLGELETRREEAERELETLQARPEELHQRRSDLSEAIQAAERTRKEAADALARGEKRQAEADKALKAEQDALAKVREDRVRAEDGVDRAREGLEAVQARIRERLGCEPDGVLQQAGVDPRTETLPERERAREVMERLGRARDNLGAVNLRAEAEADELRAHVETMRAERADLTAAIDRLREGVDAIEREGRRRLQSAFDDVNARFGELFGRLFGGGRAHLELTEAEDLLTAGVEVMASPPGKRLQTMSLLSGGEQTLTALALLFAVFLTNAAPVCVLDEVDAPLDDANVDRFCTLVTELAERGESRFLVVTHHRMTMSRMDRLVGVTMPEDGVSRVVAVDLNQAEAYAQTG
ncbi:condensin subunit Smc [Limimonas halophila]|uniref:Chromosome partition protein Smc n=1 Tax=Limimonas halophila TaxID=1082479 RepID=A0A1G7KYB0_9PROT|nr:chromosome segregation protein SMC [Limimonas halophila]SDF42195.1 condensin subunit Smc [Limimonas halophila]